MFTSVVLVAAGKGERLGLGVPKAEAVIGGKTLFEHALQTIKAFDPAQLVVVAPASLVENYRQIATGFSFQSLEVVAGGETRQDSVSNGLSKATGELVLVHDAARAFMPSEVFTSVTQALTGYDCVIPALPVTDTLKSVAGGEVSGTVDRSMTVRSQTPQGFKTAALRAALTQTNSNFTDEAALMESQGFKVGTVLGSELGLKVTTPQDLEWAKLRFGIARTGIGTDAHRFSEVGTLTLGCISWPEHPALEGHSDGDSVAHAIVDSLLGAAGLGDIGSNFGVDRPEYSGAAGKVFIKGALELIEQAGLEVVNVSVQVIADKPKIGPRRSELEAALSELVGAPVSVLATTTDGLGFLADARGVAAVATALLRERS
jgi:2-C-methyl-D-erythritol 4-phosphate cytidylyltransferase/2-C-methyl-D-erythritol 2,4-cyclodiphosphate synthase